MTKKAKVLIGAVVVSMGLFLFLVVLIPQFAMKTSMAPPKPNTNIEVSVIDKILERLELGNIAFNAPKNMNMEDRKIVTLLLSATTPTEELTGC